MNTLNYEGAIDLIRTVVGDNHIVVDPRQVKENGKDIIPVVKDASAFVYPGSIDEVQKILKIANTHKIPLWPCSKGKNWGYGGASPSQGGEVVLVLERMNKIIEVNEKLAYVVVEPGVTYRQLHEYLESHNMPFWLDCTDGPADGSVMGNALERGIGETNYGDHFGNVCGIETLLPDGSLVRTGGGPMKGYRSWNTYKWGVGPSLDGLLTQSNYGIVTKMGLWLMPKSEKYECCVFELTDEDNFPRMVDALRKLQLNGALQSKVHIINDTINFAIVAEHPSQLLKGAPCLSDVKKAELRKKWNIAPWSFSGGLYGTQAQINADKKLIKKELASLGKLQFITEAQFGLLRLLIPILKKAEGHPLWKPVADLFARVVFHKPLSLVDLMPHVYEIERGYPSDYFVKHAYYKSQAQKPPDQNIDPARDNCGLIWIGPMVPLEGDEVRSFLNLCQPIYEKYQLDLTTAIMVANPRTAVCLMSVFFDKSDAYETARAKALYEELGEVTQAAGYQAYRASTANMDRILAPAPEFQKLANTIKSALDPNNILAPGKYGISGIRPGETKVPSPLANVVFGRPLRSPGPS
jgi:4-cresol dehydrogenase (hydroxylating)